MAYFDLNVTDAMLNTETSSVVLVRDYNVLQKRDGKNYISGTIKKLRKVLSFKVWDANIVSLFENNEFRGQFLKIKFRGNEYNGVREIIINEIMASDEEVEVSEFVATTDYESLFREFGEYINQKLSRNWINVVNAIFTANPNINMYEQFKVAYAASGWHDALVGGLLNHTMKMLRLYDVVESNNPKLKEYSDLIRAGIICHDIGKIEEMQEGVYQKNAFVISHRLRGMGYIERKRDIILQNISEDELYRLESIIVSHHGGLGQSEMSTTVWSYIVHLIDNLDAFSTTVAETLENIDSAKKSKAGEPYILRDTVGLYF